MYKYIFEIVKSSKSFQCIQYFYTKYNRESYSFTAYLLQGKSRTKRNLLRSVVTKHYIYKGRFAFAFIKRNENKTIPLFIFIRILSTCPAGPGNQRCRTKPISAFWILCSSVSYLSNWLSIYFPLFFSFRYIITQ